MSILNKVQVIEFMFDCVVGSRVLLNSKINARIKKDLRSFCQELEEQFYTVMEKMVQFYSVKIVDKSVESKDAVFAVPSVETCTLLNFLRGSRG